MTDEQEFSRVSKGLMKPFPTAAVKRRVGAGGKQLDYLEGASVIRRVIRATDNQYDMEYVTHFFEDKKFFLLLSVDAGGGKRLGLGVANMIGGEDVLKGAITDAFKNAMKYYGVGLELYGEDYESRKKELSRLLAANGIKTKQAADTEAQGRFGKNVDGLTDEEIIEWIESF